MRKSLWVGVAVVAGALTLAAGVAQAQVRQSDADWLAQCKKQDGDRARYCEVRPVNWTAPGTVRIDGRPNGGVSVTGMEQGTVTGSARVQVDAKTEPEARTIASQILVDTGTGTLRATGPEKESGVNWSVSFVLAVPKRADLEIQATNGPVSVNGVSSQIQIDTTNGPLSLTDLGGNVKARTTNGPLAISLSGASWIGAGLDAETRNGPVSVKLPDGYSALLDVATVNGPMRVGIPHTDTQSSRSKSFQSAIGAGGAPLRIHTQNGPVSVEKK